MAEVKNSFLSSKMNKDLDDRLIPNGEYRNAVNVSINKSTGENVGTAQTVLGNEQTINFNTSLNSTGLEVIGVFPDESSNTIYALLTNNVIKPYVPTGAVGDNTAYPSNQSSVTGGPIEITTPGATYTDEIDGTTTTIVGSGSGLTVSVTVDGSGGITEARIQTFGSGYAVNDVVQVNGGNSTARLTIKSILPNDHFVVAYNITTTNITTICQGSFLNFSTLSPVNGINLLEDLLFFTDNRNQPRKVNITRSNPYYTTEDQISVAKYYPYETIELYQPSNIAGAVVHTGTTNAVVNSNVISFATGPTPSSPTPNISLGVTGVAATLLASGQGYALASAVTTEGGSGSGLSINILSLSSGNGIATFSIASEGSGYSTGDVLTVVQSSSSNTAELTISVVKENTFITDVTNWPTSITVNQTQDLPAGTAIKLSEPETTMKDAISTYLPVEANAGGSGKMSIQNGTRFYVKKDSYTGNSNIINTNIFIKNSSGTYINSNITVVSKLSVSNPSDSWEIIASSALDALTSPVRTLYLQDAEVKFAIPNPYFDQVFKDNANVDFLSDKFVRFSYRYRFDDGEYSLMAPFTQPCFIPEQDGYFTSAEIGEGNVSDQEKAYRSTEVSFMENKVNKILLNVPLPSSANSLGTNFKVTEIDILYKESDQTSIKVVDSIPLLNNVQGTSEYYQYEYGSKPPFKTLPQSDTVRVFDKIPVKAAAQEVSSNRIIYGNFQDKHTPPSFLNYTLASGAKGVIGAVTSPKFTISENKITNYTSIVEYPNANLKENRTYEVGVVLADRFGRQSTVIFSKTKLSLLSSFIASSRYSSYRSLEDNSISSTNPTGGILNFDGDSLKIQFIDIINSFKNEATGAPGLYNGDSNSQDYNPLGWYSFKIVVKQTEQEYYNVYIPTAMAAYPLDRTKEINTTSHVVLYNDNINKVPRDLTEVGPTQREFPSSVRMFGRVNNALSFGARAGQFYPGRAASLSTTIATIKDLFDFQEFPDLSTVSGDPYIFYNYDYTGGAGGSGTTFTTSDGSSLIARIESSNDTKFGLQIQSQGYYTNAPSLNVFETAPIVSLLDIYYETSTAGRIDLLNKAIAEGPAANIFFGLSTFGFFATEAFEGLNSSSDQQRICTTPFQPLNFNGAPLGVAAENTCEIISVTNQIGNTFNEDGIPYFVAPSEGLGTDGIFGIEPLLDASGNATGQFRIVLTKSPGPQAPGLVVTGGSVLDEPRSYVYTFNLRFTNPAAAEDFNIERTFELGNVNPPSHCNGETYQPQPGSINVIDRAGNDAYDCNCNSSGSNPVAITNNIFDLAEGDFGRLFGVTCQNGSKTQSLNKEGMVFSFEFLRETINNLDYFYQGNQIDPFFTISNDNIPTSGALANQQAIISVPQQNNLTLNRKYVLAIKACDAGNPNLCSICEITFNFSESPSIAYDGGAFSEILPFPFEARSDYFLYDVCQNRWWKSLVPQVPIPDNPSEFLTSSPLFCPVRVETRYAPVEMKIAYSIYNGGNNRYPAEINGDLGMHAIFNNQGYPGTPLFATASASGVYAEPPESVPINGADGIKKVLTNGVQIPAGGSVDGFSTTTLKLPIQPNQIGWGNSASNENVGIVVSPNATASIEGCNTNAKPVVQIQLVATRPT